MNETFTFAVAVFMSFFAVMNPIANTTMFLILTADKNTLSRKKIALNSVIVAFVITTLFCIAGNNIFDLFGITLPAFKMTGGILITLIGFESLRGQQSKIQTPNIKAHEESAQSDLNVAVSPLGIPLLSGPGTITTAVNYVSGGGIFDMFITILCFMFLCLITYVCFLFSKEITKFLGQTGVNVTIRLMGLILAVVGMEMIVTGLKGAFPFMN